MKKLDILRLIPLGGLGEIGKNMNALEYGDDIIILDLGSKFATLDEPGVDIILPDTRYLERNRHKLRAAVITHGHMDHIGGVGHFLAKFPLPVYGAPFTITMIEKQLEEVRLPFKPQLRVINPDTHERVQLGAFNIELVRVGHPIPDATAIVVRIPVGMVVDTGDWRFEDDPIIGRPMDLARLNEIAKEGVTLLMGDSTNAQVPGHTAKERDIALTFDQLLGRAPGRVILSMFASNLFRVQLAINATAKSGRKLAITGRSMLGNIEAAIKTGHLKVPNGLIVRVQDGVKDQNVAILTTGSQGEPNSGLRRMAIGKHPSVKIKPGDSIILSSSIIPGNALRITQLVDTLMREGAKVYQNGTRELDGLGLLHASGHANRDDLAAFLQMMKPKYLAPIHGSFAMQTAHAGIALANGVAQDRIFMLNIGDVLELTGTSAKLGQPVESGSVYFHGSMSGTLGDVEMQDRVALAEEGVILISATLNRHGKLLTSPNVVSRGFVSMKDNQALIKMIAAKAKTVIDKNADADQLTTKLRDAVNKLVYEQTGRRPMVLSALSSVRSASKV